MRFPGQKLQALENRYSWDSSEWEKNNSVLGFYSYRVAQASPHGGCLSILMHLFIIVNNIFPSAMCATWYTSKM